MYFKSTRNVLDKLKSTFEQSPSQFPSHISNSSTSTWTRGWTKNKIDVPELSVQVLGCSSLVPLKLLSHEVPTWTDNRLYTSILTGELNQQKVQIVAAIVQSLNISFWFRVSLLDTGREGGGRESLFWHILLLLAIGISQWLLRGFPRPVLVFTTKNGTHLSHCWFFNRTLIT